MEIQTVKGKLLYPPSVNNYWTTSIGKTPSGKIIKSKHRTLDVQKYVKDCVLFIKSQKIKPIFADRLELELLVSPPDKRKRDLDNLAKASQDILQYAKIITDDYCIWKLIIERRSPTPGGEINFTLKEIK